MSDVIPPIPEVRAWAAMPDPRVLWQSGSSKGCYRVVYSKEKIIVEAAEAVDAMGNPSWKEIGTNTILEKFAFHMVQCGFL